MASNEYLTMADLIKDYYDAPIGTYLNQSVTINNVTLPCDIYRVAAETVLTASVFTGCTAVDANTQIVIGRDMSVASGTTLTPPYRCKGIVIGDVGTFTNEGTISMTARGASGAGKNIQLTADYMISAVGGAGGSSQTVSNGNAHVSGVSKASDPGKSPATGVLSCGGGASGAVHNRQGDSAGTSGAGGSGTSFSGGAGGGGVVVYYAAVNGGAGSSSGGAGGAAGKGGSFANWAVSGGAGNLAGSDSTGGTGSITSNSPNGTGGLVVIMATKIISSGSLLSVGGQANSVSGATSGIIGRACGGSSGGGCIVLISRERNVTGTHSVAGGAAATGGGGGGGSYGTANGGAGGAGTYASYIVDDLVLVNLPVEFAVTDSNHVDNIVPSEAVRFLAEMDEDKLYYDILGTRHEVGSDKQDTLTAGDGIDITGSTISTTQEFTDGTNTITHRDTIQINSPLTIEDNDDDEITEIGVNTDVDFSVFKHPSAETEQSPIIPVKYIYSRWLRFDPTDRKSLIIKAGTSILLANGEYKSFIADTSFDLSDDISTNGANYYVYMNNSGVMRASTATTLADCVKLGRFHTLCANAGTTLTMKAPASPSSGLAVGGTYLVKPYKQADDPDFYSFYNKQITAVSVNSKYDVITMTHPLVNYQAGDILPESVWCSTFKPDCLFDDAMVFDKGTGIAVDVYLQSGTGFNTRSAYGATHTVSREPYNHMGDMLSVGKRLLRDNEFTSIALGSNEGTSIAGSADPSGGPVGGHSDTDGRRMISAIGVEEACGYLWTWLQEVSSPGTGTTDNWDTATAVSDGQGSFGKEYWTPYVARAGGNWYSGAQAGSRARGFNNRRVSVNAFSGGRGSTTVIYGII